MKHRIAVGTLLLGLVSAGLAAARQTPTSGFSSPGLEQAMRKPVNPSDPQTSAISGLVIDGATKEPVVGAFVAVSAPGSAIGSPDRQMTDAKGRFVFARLPAAPNYIVTAERIGYVPGNHTRSDKPGATTTLIALRAGEWRSDVRIMLWPPSAISGVVADERGEPVAGVFVRALSRMRIQGRDELAAGPVTTTDDRGVYRLAGLTPGRYLIQVPSVQATVPAASAAAPAPTAGSPSLDVVPGARLVLSQYPTPPAPVGGRRRAYPMTFHPAARLVAEAQVVPVGAGEERVSDVRLEPVDAFRVSGRVDGPVESLASLILRLLPAGLETIGLGSEVATALVAPDGSFTFANVPSGIYSIEAPRAVAELGTPAQPGAMALPPPPGRPVCRTLTPDCMPFAAGSTNPIELAPAAGTAVRSINLRSTPHNLWGRTPITVERGDVTNVQIAMRPAGVMRGTVVFETVRGRPRPGGSASGLMYLEPAAPGLGLAVLSPARPTEDKVTDTFTIEGLLAGPYWLRKATSAPGWVTKSILWNGRDYTDVPFDASSQNIDGVVVTLTSAAPVVTGVVRDGSGNPVSGAGVLVFPTDRALWSHYGFRPARIKFVITTGTGAYQISTLPAGDYFIVATDGSDPNAHHAPGFFERNEGLATRRSLSWGQTHTFDLVVSEIRP